MMFDNLVGKQVQIFTASDVYIEGFLQGYEENWMNILEINRSEVLINANDISVIRLVKQSCVKQAASTVPPTRVSQPQQQQQQHSGQVFYYMAPTQRPDSQAQQLPTETQLPENMDVGAYERIDLRKWKNVEPK